MDLFSDIFVSLLAPEAVCISPGAGSAGSFRLRFMATLLLWRSLLASAVSFGEVECWPLATELRRPLVSSLVLSRFNPALTAAAAAREVVRGGEFGSSSGTALLERFVDPDMMSA